MENFYKTMQERGFIEQATDPEEMESLFQQKTVTAYIGFDPTAKSLHVGSLIPIMALAHLKTWPSSDCPGGRWYSFDRGPQR